MTNESQNKLLSYIKPVNMAVCFKEYLTETEKMDNIEILEQILASKENQL